jgi:K+-sensing histidine kinase KdpD
VPVATVLLMVGAATIVIHILGDFLATLNLVSILFLIPVLAAALRWGIWPAMLAAMAGALAADYFFYPPLYSFWISDSQNVADLIVYLLVALVGGNLAASLRQRERQMQDLYEYSGRLAACFTTADLISATQDYLSLALGRPVVLADAKALEEAVSTEIAVPMDVRRSAAARIAGNATETHAIFDDASGRYWLARRVRLGVSDYVVFIELGSAAGGRRGKLNRRIDAILAEATENLTRIDFARAVEESRLQAQSDALKNALVATVSHELRTPLVSILGAASVLDQIPDVARDARARSLVATVHDEAARLDAVMQNLIATARITAGVEGPGAHLTDPVDIVHAAIAQRKTQLAGHKLEVLLASGMPLVEVQSALVENALAQLIDNAAKYSPAGSTIKVSGAVDREWVVLSVSDQGTGLTADEQQRVGQRSFRGALHAATIPGSGLGLWIASTFIAANGGRLDAESSGPGHGTVARIRLPAVGKANGR